MFQHFKYNNLYIDKFSSKNNSIIDEYIAMPKNSRVFKGDFSYAGIFQKLNMLGFTCKNTNDRNKIEIKQVFCKQNEYEDLNNLIKSLE